MPGWRAYYAGGRTFGSGAHTWERLPEEGVLGVVLFLPSGANQLVQGGDWYWLEGGEPVCSGTHPEFGEWLDPPAGVPDRLLKQSAPALQAGAWDALKSAMLGAEP